MRSMAAPSASRSTAPPAEPTQGASASRRAGSSEVFERWLPWWHAVGIGVPSGTTVLALSSGSLAQRDIPLAVAVNGILVGAYVLVFVRRSPWRIPLSAALGYAVLLDLGFLLLLQLTPQYALLQLAIFPQLFFLLPAASAATGAGGVALALAATDLARRGWRLDLAFSAIVADVIQVAFFIALALWVSDILRQSADRRRLIDELELARRELAGAERQAGILDERSRLAREIHDTLAQGFASIVAHLESADATLGADPDRARGHVREAEAVARTSLDEARGLAWALRSDTLTQADLPAALERVAATAAALGAFSADLTVTGTVRELHPDIEITLLRAAQESLSNIRGHAAARHVTITLSYFPDQVSLDVADDGRGFDPASREGPSRTGGLGLLGMRERAEGLGGSLAVESAVGEGTTIAVSLPAVPTTPRAARG